MITTRSSRGAVLVAFLVLTVLTGVLPAHASLGGITLESGNTSSPSDHDGDGDSDPGATTEDTDSNDGTADGQADDGDNAHPSGKDRSVENGGSGTQGKAESNPDDSRGPQRFEGSRGDDKADGAGGTDLADQDGNNGCGNDDDFNDDNNGHCGKSATPPGASSCGEASQAGYGWECSAGRASRSETSRSESEVRGLGFGRDKNDELLSRGTHGGTKAEDNIDNADGSGAEAGDADATGAGTGPSAQASATSAEVERAESNPATETGVGARRDSACPDGSMPDGSGHCAVAPDSVLGAAIRQAGATVYEAAKALGAVLPFTGAGDLLLFLAIAILLIAGGILLLRKRSSES